jgi:carboxypeptidase C (cathepsin A)
LNLSLSRCTQTKKRTGLSNRRKSEVGGLALPRPLLSYSGFITVNASAASHLFFWFFPAASGNASAPVVLWLQGGPGATGLFGLLKEHGAFYADVDQGRFNLKHLQSLPLFSS